MSGIHRRRVEVKSGKIALLRSFSILTLAPLAKDIPWSASSNHVTLQSSYFRADTNELSLLVNIDIYAYKINTSDNLKYQVNLVLVVLLSLFLKNS